nr:hypothetical protein [uncultured Rhodopila sp.]
MESVAEAEDSIVVAPYVPHPEIGASTIGTLKSVLVRSDTEAVVINLVIETAEKSEAV